MARIKHWDEQSQEWIYSDASLISSNVNSINGKTGDVILTANDIKALDKSATIPATLEMTENVGISEDGKLKVKPGATAVKLWENASPNSAFNPQTISLNINQYSLLTIIFKTNESYTSVSVPTKLYGVDLSTTYIQPWDDGSISFWHRIFQLSTNGLIIKNGIWNNDTKGVNLNESLACIPFTVYGLK